MWAWILHRLSGVVIALYGIAHLILLTTLSITGGFDRVMELFHQPYILVLELCLLAVVLYHVFNGFRVILFDLGIGLGAQKQLFWGLMAAAIVLFGFAAAAIAPAIAG